MFNGVINPARIAVAIGASLGAVLGGSVLPCTHQRAASPSMLQIGLASSRDGRPAEYQKIVIGANLVNVPVAVSDHNGRFVSGLTRDEFEIFDNGVKQEVAHFSDMDTPVS